MKRGKVIGIAHQHRGDGIQPCCLNTCQICFDQQLSFFDLLSVFDVNLEAFATQTHGFQTYMDQNFSTVFRNNGDT